MEQNLWEVPVENIIALANPMADDVWGCGVITKDDVLTCYDYYNASSAYDVEVNEDTDSHKYNVQRITYLCDFYNFSNTTDSNPITIMLDSDNGYPIIDGNHRIAAAYVLDEETVIVNIVGDLAHARNILKPVSENI